jgi:hypothetical protein
MLASSMVALRNLDPEAEQRINTLVRDVENPARQA